MPKEQIEQVWYTWGAGLGSIMPNGFDFLTTERQGWFVRAVSKQLLENNGKRLVNLDRFLRYFLPSKADPYTLELEDAPICLCLATVEGERILVNKQYTGVDGYSREGVHFAHLLAGLPDFYSASDAILTWRSPFWQKAEPDDRRTTLDAISLQSLAAEATFSWDQMSERVKAYLPFVIQFYLAIKHISIQRNNTTSTDEIQKAHNRLFFWKNASPFSSDNTQQPNPQHIYIAAPADEVAEVIYWLTKSLPKSLLNALTFSTYEKDVLAKDLPLVVGTCWVPGPEPGQDLPLECYDEGLAVNFYTGKCSLVESSPALEYGKFATERLANYRADEEERKEFEDLLKEAAQYTSVNQLIAYYLKYEEDIRGRYDPRKLPAILQEMRTKLERAIKKLKDSRYRQLMIQEFQEPSEVWETEGIHTLNTLRKEYEEGSEVDRGLLQLAEDAKVVALNGMKADNIPVFMRCLDIMECATPPTPGAKSWRDLFATLKKESSATQTIISKHWDLQARFLKIWSRALMEGDKLDGFWLRISWRHLGEFLALDVDARWEFFALKYLVTNEKELLTPGIARQLKFAYPHLKRCIKGLLQTKFSREQKEGTSTPWETARSLYVALATNDYPHRVGLLGTWLALPLKKERDLEDMLQAVQLQLLEQQYILERYGPTYIPRYPRFPLFLQWFKRVIDHSYSYEQQVNLLTIWLDTKLDEATLKEVLSALRMSTEEWVRFFETSGQKHIQQYPNSAMLISLFADVSHQAETFPKKMSLLRFWLSLEVSQETLERLLQRVRLDRSEMKRILLRAGCRYLLKYPGSRVLYKQFWTFLVSFEVESVAVGQVGRDFIGAQLLEQLHQSLHEPSFTASLTSLPEESQQALAELGALAKAWWLVGSFFKQPALTKAGLTQLSEGLFTIILLPDYAARIRQPLLLKLAQGLHDWQVDRSELTVAINMLETVLAREDVFLMVDLLVEQIRQDSRSSDRVRAERAESLITSCLYLALNFTIISDDPQDYETFGVPLLAKLLDIAGDEIYERFDGWGRHHSNKKIQETWEHCYALRLQRTQTVTLPSSSPKEEKISEPRELPPTSLETNTTNAYDPTVSSSQNEDVAVDDQMPDSLSDITDTDASPNQLKSEISLNDIAPDPPSRWERVLLILHTIIAHLGMRMALRSRYIDSIVYEYDYYRELLISITKYLGKSLEIPKEMKRGKKLLLKQGIAKEFEEACRIEYTSKREVEKRIVDAYTAIEMFNRKHRFVAFFPSLILSPYQKVRYQRARKYMDTINRSEVRPQRETKTKGQRQRKLNKYPGQQDAEAARNRMMGGSGESSK
jgi:hypothetical protein